MWFDRAALKRQAHARMGEAKISPYIVALVFFIVSFIISELSNRLLFPPDQVYFEIDRSYRLVLVIEPEYYSRIFTEPFAYVINFLLEVVSGMLSVGMTLFCLNVAKRAASSMWNLLDGFANFFKILWLFILTGLMTMLWTLLFIVPGIIAAYRYRLALYILLDHPEMRVIDCVRESKRLMRGRKAELFVLDLSFLGWFLLTIVPFVSVYVTPYTSTTYAVYYLAVIDEDTRRGAMAGERLS